MLGQTAFATWQMKAVLPYQGWSLVDLQDVFVQPLAESARQILPYVVQTSILLLFALLFCWVSVGFWTALMGFFQLLRGKDRYSISASSPGNEPIPAEARTALVMPIANEDVPRVFAGLRATYESLKATGELEHFDIFVLSDSNDPDTCVAEQQAWVELCRAVDGFGHIFYRRRRRRVKRKSGNIDDFCRRWGSSYRYMVVLDADSVMSGCSTSLVRLMEANPNAGIIQTAPKASGMDTLYARLQQFATRVYGPLFTAGLNFWQLGESHYWGHNAIIRVKPFIEHCALAPLPGTGAGAILSHDFVEAALMRRAGWGVWIAYDLPGSYEELPPNLLDELKRDRRWCHGNLMNFRLFMVRGVHTVHRLVFLTGVMSYLSAPLWFLFLLLSTGLLAIHTLMEPEYFLQPNQLYPLGHAGIRRRPSRCSRRPLRCCSCPSCSACCWSASRARRPMAVLRVVLSMLIETLFSVLLAPVRMLFHSVFVTAAFLGWSVQWKSPQRGDDATPWGGAAPAWFADRHRRALDGTGCLAGCGLPLVAGADRGVADPLGAGVGDHQPYRPGPGRPSVQAVPDSRGTRRLPSWPTLTATSSRIRRTRCARASSSPSSTRCTTPWSAPWRALVTPRWCRPRSTCASASGGGTGGGAGGCEGRGGALAPAQRSRWHGVAAPPCGTTRQVPTGWRAIGRSTPRRSHQAPASAS